MKTLSSINRELREKKIAQINCIGYQIFGDASTPEPDETPEKNGQNFSKST
jgi:hypothetical protein